MRSVSLRDSGKEPAYLCLNETNVSSTNTTSYVRVGLFKPEDNWSVLDVELGISSILICAEMVVFAILHVYSFSYRPYVIQGHTTPVRKSLLDGFNPVDMVREIIWALQDCVLLLQGKPLPTRVGHLNFKLKRAYTMRLLKRNRFFKSRKPKTPVTPGSEEDLDTGDLEEQVRASLLEHPDGTIQLPFR